MPKLEIANENRYGHRKIEEEPRWDRWDARMPDVKDQQLAIDLYNKFGCGEQIRFCPCPNPRGEFQTLPNIISFRIIPHLKSVITCVRYIIQGRNRNSKKQSIIEMTFL